MPDGMGKAIDPCGMGKSPLEDTGRLLLGIVGINALLSVSTYF